MNTLIKITTPDSTMYVQQSSEGGTLFTGDRTQAMRYCPQDAAEVASRLPVKSLPGAVSMEAAA